MLLLIGAVATAQTGCTGASDSGPVSAPTKVVYSRGGPVWAGEGAGIGLPSHLTGAGAWSPAVTLGGQTLRNVSDEPLTLLSVDPVGATAGLDLVGIRGATFELGTGGDRVGAVEEFPIPEYEAAKPVRGIVLDPFEDSEEQVDLLLGLRTNTPVSGYEALDVTYRMSGKTYRVRVPLAFHFCRGDIC